MPTPLQPELDALAAALTDARLLVRAVAAGKRRGAVPPWRRVELRPVDLKAGPALQVVRYDERQAHTSNHPFGDDADAAVAALLAEPFGNWHVETTEATIELRVTKKGEAQVHRGAPPASGPERSHDKAKERLLDPAHPALRTVGIADAHGRIKPTRQAKYRQVEELLRQLRVVLDESGLAASATADPLRLVDLGCGNAYLTFGAQAYLGEQLDRPVELTGIDVRASARATNTERAAQLGWSDRMRFVEGTIAGQATDEGMPERPDVVLALHACDTATDDALARAVRWEAPVILAAPCCHHDIATQLAGVADRLPDGLRLITRHGLLRERFADTVTDGLRAAILRMLGYRVDVVEFVGSEHTPRNTLIRAIHTGAPADPGTIGEYRALTEGWGLQPRLSALLADRIDPVLEA